MAVNAKSIRKFLFAFCAYPLDKVESMSLEQLLKELSENNYTREYLLWSRV